MNLYNILSFILSTHFKSRNVLFYLWLRQFSYKFQLYFIETCKLTKKKDVYLYETKIIQIHKKDCCCLKIFNILINDLKKVYSSICDDNFTYHQVSCIENVDFNLKCRNLIMNNTNNNEENINVYSFENENINNKKKIVKYTEHINFQYIYKDDCNIYENNKIKFTIYGIFLLLNSPNFTNLVKLYQHLDIIELYTIIVMVKKLYFSQISFEYLLPEYMKSVIRKKNKLSLLSSEIILYETYKQLTYKQNIKEINFEYLKKYTDLKNFSICHQLQIDIKNESDFIKLGSDDQNHKLQLNYNGCFVYITLIDDRIYCYNDCNSKIFLKNLFIEKKEIRFKDSPFYFVECIIQYNNILVTDVFYGDNVLQNLKKKIKKSYNINYIQNYKIDDFFEIKKKFYNYLILLDKKYLPYNGVVLKKDYKIFRYKFDSTKYLYLNDNIVFIPAINLKINILTLSHQIEIKENKNILIDNISKYSAYFATFQTKKKLNLLLYKDSNFFIYLILNYDLILYPQYYLYIKDLKKWKKVSIVKINFNKIDLNGRIQDIVYIKSNFKSIYNIVCLDTLLNYIK